MSPKSKIMKTGEILVKKIKFKFFTDFRKPKVIGDYQKDAIQCCHEAWESMDAVRRLSDKLGDSDTSTEADQMKVKIQSLTDDFAIRNK